MQETQTPLLYHPWDYSNRTQESICSKEEVDFDPFLRRLCGLEDNCVAPTGLCTLDVHDDDIPCIDNDYFFLSFRNVGNGNYSTIVVDQCFLPVEYIVAWNRIDKRGLHRKFVKLFHKHI